MPREAKRPHVDDAGKAQKETEGNQASASKSQAQKPQAAKTSMPPPPTTNKA